jgi:phosphonate transport system permease protein
MSDLPPRMRPPPIWQFMAGFLLLAALLGSLHGLDVTAFLRESAGEIPANVGSMAKRMWPPSLERIRPVGLATLQTFEMALFGTAIGLPASFLLAILAARNLSPHPAVYFLTRGVVTLVRTIPSLIWAIFMLVAVGLGPRAGTMAIAIGTIGFCGRFFAEAMEEVDPRPREALTALGATRSGAILCAVFPAAFPSFVNTSLFSLEHAIRSSAVLGMVGAGGIGNELEVSMKTFHYDEAITIIALVFAMVVGVEQICAAVRRRLF